MNAQRSSRWCCALSLGLLLVASSLTTLVSPVAAQAPLPGAFVYPLMAPRLSSPFGMRRHPLLKFTRQHKGVDLAAADGSYVRAILPGRVVFADFYAGYGNLVTINHGGGKVSLYAHLSSIKAIPGSKVTAGAILGAVGSTGHSSGPHLHFEWRENNVAVNPLKVFPTLLEQADG